MLSRSWAVGSRASPWGTGGGRVRVPLAATCVCAARAGRSRQMRAMAGEPERSQERRRLVDVLRMLPKLYESYFRSRRRRALFGGLAILGGFYVALRVSISYGSLPVNDWLAAAVFYLFTELVTWYNYSRPVITFPVAMVNNFKVGFTYGLFVGAFKL